jgi:hypothetical protein
MGLPRGESPPLFQPRPIATSRPGAGAYRYDELRPVRPEGAIAAVHSQSHTEGQADASADLAGESPATDSELPGIHAYYAALMAAVRGTLSPRDAAVLIRNLKNQKILAVRAAKNRRHAMRANQRRPNRPAAAPSSAPKRQFG